MGCIKTLTLGGGCALNACQDEAIVTWTGYFGAYTIAFAPDLCYACCVGVNATNTLISFLKYEPATNTLVSKGTFAGAGIYQRELVYDAKHQLFVTAVGGTDLILIFDPQTDVVTSFHTGLGVANWSLVYVPQKEKIYGHFGVDGTAQHYVGYIDMDLLLVVQLGIIPALGASRPNMHNMTYSPVADSLYGCWIGGASSRLIKFNLATNTGTLLLSGIEKIDCCWDSDRSLLILFYNDVVEVNTATDLVVRTTAIPAPSDMRYNPVYVSSMKKVFVLGDTASGFYGILSYDTQTFVSTVLHQDYDYWSLCNFQNGSFLVSAEFGAGVDGVKRMCLT